MGVCAACWCRRGTIDAALYIACSKRCVVCKMLYMRENDHREVIIIYKSGKGKREIGAVMVLLFYDQPMMIFMNSIIMIGKKMYELHGGIAKE